MRYALLGLAGCGRINFGPQGDAAGVAPDGRPPDAAGPDAAASFAITHLATRANHGCVRTDDARVICWGDNTMGQCGLPAGDPINTDPVLVDLATTPQAVVSGEDGSCVLGPDRSLTCWGKRLGTGLLQAPGPAPFTDPVQDISLGQHQACVIDDGGDVWCWGDNLCSGVSPVPGLHPVPTQVSGLVAAATAIAVTDVYSCAVVAGDPVCWGAPRTDAGGNCIGELTTPTPQPLGTDVVQLDGGCHEHMCARTVDDRVFCLGTNDDGQLGAGDLISRNEWNEVTLPNDAGALLDLGVGCFQTCVLADGGVYCWGDNSHGQLGLPTGGADQLTPTRSDELSRDGVLAIEGGGRSGCQAVGTDAFCIGENDDRELGDGTDTDRATLVRVDLELAGS